MRRINRIFSMAAIAMTTLMIGVAAVSFYMFLFAQPDAEIKKSPVAEVEALSMDDPVFTPPQVDQNDPEAFDPEGTYSLAGVVAPEFEDFDSFTIDNKILDVECDANDFGKLKKPVGSLVLNDSEEGTVIELNSLEITKNNSVRFRSDAHNGTSFGFEGEFLIKGNFYTLDSEAKVLKGTLTKYKGGKKVSETEVSFTWSIDLTCVC